MRKEPTLIEWAILGVIVLIAMAVLAGCDSYARATVGPVTVNVTVPQPIPAPAGTGAPGNGKGRGDEKGCKS